MNVSVTWFINGLKEVKADAYIVVDVLRFSTTVTVALNSGFSRVYVFADLDRAIEYSRRIKAPLVAEVEGVKPADADLDNSPTAILEWVSKYGVGSGELVIRTTSGALIIDEAIKLGLSNVFVGSILNAKAVAETLVKLKISSANIVCAGYRRSHFSIEDFLGAGAITYELNNLVGGKLRMDDGALAASRLFEYVVSSDKLLETIRLGHHGSFLWNTGRSKDVELACMLNNLNVVPKLMGNAIGKYVA